MQNGHNSICVILQKNRPKKTLKFLYNAIWTTYSDRSRQDEHYQLKTGKNIAA
jgi:hypothetical protein